METGEEENVKEDKSLYIWQIKMIHSSRWLRKGSSGYLILGASPSDRYRYSYET